MQGRKKKLVLNILVYPKEEKLSDLTKPKWNKVTLRDFLEKYAHEGISSCQNEGSYTAMKALTQINI